MASREELRNGEADAEELEIVGLGFPLQKTKEIDQSKDRLGKERRTTGEMAGLSDAAGIRHNSRVRLVTLGNTTTDSDRNTTPE